MSYQVLARKWRPRRFSEMVGQEHVLRALVNALDRQRLHHAFLFTGTRGVGKTTIARILAKSLNCEKGVSSEPCCECSACTEIDAGRFVDLLEVDAASRTKVDETRELLENVQYMPARGRYKVYLIDEVHMLSGHSFNALLKTLEEPPPHVKFLLATTEPSKLPVTVLSRCLQFGLKRLPLALIERQIERILAAEKVAAEPAAIELIAREAEGSMRDALSLVDQAIAHAGGALVEAEVRDMLGSIDRGRIHELLATLAADDAAGVLALVAALDEHAPDYEGVLGELAAVLQRVAILKAVPAAAAEWQDRAELQPVAARLDASEVQLLYQIAITSRRDLALAPDPRTGFEMALLRMLAFRPEGGSEARAGSESTSTDGSAPRSTASRAAVTSSSEAADAATWPALVERMALRGMVRELAVNCALGAREGDRFRLTLAPAHRHLLSDKASERLQEALGRVLGAPARVTIEVANPAGETPAQVAQRALAQRTAQAAAALAEDPVVRALGDTFGATLDRDTVRPDD